MSKLFRTNVVLAAGAAAVMSLFPAATALALPASHSIVYKVLGQEGVGVASVSYKDASGEKEAGTVRVPWSTSFQINVGGDQDLEEKLGLYVNRPESEENAGGLYVCEIWVDGQLREKVERDLEVGGLVCFLGDDENDEVLG